jgi:hypothetical protein
MIGELSDGDPSRPASAENPGEFLGALDDELSAARSQLDHYQRLIDEIPSLYEAKFRYRVQDLAQDIRRLMEERQSLQEQIRRCIEGQAAPAPLPTIATNARPARRALAALAAATRRFRHLPRWQLALAAGAAALALAVPVGLGGWATRGRPAPEAPEASQPASQPLPEIPPQLRLRAKGEVWLELRSLTNQPVLETTLRPGQDTSIPLGDGLRIRSGRPHLLEVAIADQPFAPLAPANDFAWRTVVAPDSGHNPALKPRVTDKSS